MAHNFKITDGEIYVSKSGHDSNDGSTPDTAIRTISYLFTRDKRTIIGAGHYTEGSLVGFNYLFADGKVILDSIGGYLTYQGANTNGLEFRNMDVRSRGGVLSNFITKNGILQPHGISFTTLNAIVIENEIIAPNDWVSFEKSILIDCTGEIDVCKDTYVNRNTRITLKDPMNLSYSNFRGVAKIKGSFFPDGTSRDYVVQDALTGTPQDHGYDLGIKWLNEYNLTEDGYTGTITGLDTKLATCINREPLFNNETLQDFSLQAGSPLIGRASDGGNISGSKLAVSVINRNNGMGNLEVIPSPEIDVTNINTYTLKKGYTEGYIDYIQKIGSSPLTLGVISPISVLNFNTDFGGGSLENNNVPDSEPFTSDYPRRLVTTSDASDAQTLEISGHDIQVGEFVRVNGEDREVISVTLTNVRVATIFRAKIPSGSVVQVATQTTLATLTPNRLTYQLRTSKKDSKPVLLSDWDNDADPLYGVSGKFLTQEWDTVPGYVIDSDTNKLYGAGNSNAPRGLTLNEISCRWVNLRVFIRNNYGN